MLTNNNYYEDHDWISNSSLCDFVYYDIWGSRYLTPDTYRIKHLIPNPIKMEQNDAMLKGTIVDDYFSVGPHILDEYEVVGRRTGKHEKEINNGMKADIDVMINCLKQFKRFQDFIKLPDTKGQLILQKEIELMNSEGEFIKIKIKGKPDFINHKEKIIVDLKTTGSINKVIDDLQFKGQAKPYARYIRQGAMYNHLAGGDYRFILAIVDDNLNLKWLEIPQYILRDSWALIQKDLLELDNFLKNPEKYPDESIFLPEDSEEIELI